MNKVFKCKCALINFVKPDAILYLLRDFNFTVILAISILWNLESNLVLFSNLESISQTLFYLLFTSSGDFIKGDTNTQIRIDAT